MCFNIETAVALEEAELGKLTWLLTDASSSGTVSVPTRRGAARVCVCCEAGRSLNVCACVRVRACVRAWRADAIQPVSGFAAAAGVLAIEVGPRLNVMTPFSTNAISICKSIDLEKVSRVECSRRVSIKLAGADLSTLPAADTDKVAVSTHPRKTHAAAASARRAR